MFQLTERPTETRWGKTSKRKDDFNFRLEKALEKTYFYGDAIKVCSGRFLSSAAKGRLWKRGYRVHYQTLKGYRHVVAWVSAL